MAATATITIITATTMTTHDLSLCAVPGEPASARGTGELLKLLTFLSPAFPVGAFSYSHGLEWQIDSGAIRSDEALRAWLTDLLDVGGAWNDAVLFAEAYRAGKARDWKRLSAVAELAEALASSRERHLETTAQGRAFLDAVVATWPCDAARTLIEGDGAPYPIAVAAVAAGHQIALASALPAYLNAFTANLVSVGVRLIPIGQTAGLKIIATLHPLIAATSRRAKNATLDDLGSATILSDIASMRHEEQYSRVFRT
jgi:urease accessory protein